MFRISSLVIISIFTLHTSVHSKSEDFEFSTTVDSLADPLQRLRSDGIVLTYFSKLDECHDFGYQSIELHSTLEKLNKTCEIPLPNGKFLPMSPDRATIFGKESNLAITWLQEDLAPLESIGTNETNYYPLWLHAHFVNLADCSAKHIEILLDDENTKIFNHHEHFAVPGENDAIDVFVEAPRLCQTAFCQVKLMSLEEYGGVLGYKASNFSLKFDRYTKILPINSRNVSQGYYLITMDGTNHTEISKLSSNYSVVGSINTQLSYNKLWTNRLSYRNEHRRLVTCVSNINETTNETDYNCLVVNPSLEVKMTINWKSAEQSWVEDVANTKNGGFLVLMLTMCSDSDPCESQIVKMQEILPNGWFGRKFHLREIPKDSSVKIDAAHFDEGNNRFCYTVKIKPWRREDTNVDFKCFRWPNDEERTMM